jgi:hypothetical protein
MRNWIELEIVSKKLIQNWITFDSKFSPIFMHVYKLVQFFIQISCMVAMICMVVSLI